MTENEEAARRLYFEDVNAEEREGVGGWKEVPKAIRFAYLDQVARRVGLPHPTTHPFSENDRQCERCGFPVPDGYRFRHASWCREQGKRT